MVGAGFREEAGAVVVDVGVEVLLIEGVDQRCPALWNMAITEELSHYSAVLAFRQGIIVRMA